MIKKGLFILFMALFPTIVYADSYYADVYMRNNGDVEVHEATVKDGSYEYLQRVLLYGYDGENSLYSSSNVVLTKICEADKDNPLTNIGSCFTKVANAKEGSSLVYTENKDTSKVKYTLYNTNESKSAFYMEYTFKNAFVGFNDVNEALITLFTADNEEKFKNMAIKIHYPDAFDGYESWLHGPLKFQEDKEADYISYEASDLAINKALDIRIVAPKDSILTSKEENAKRLNAIYDLEKTLDNKLMNERKLAQRKLIIKIAIVAVIVLFACLYTIGLGVLIIKHYFANDKEVKADFDKEYFTEFPSNDPPSAVEFLFNHQVSFNSFKATILYIIYKKGLLVNMLEDDFELTANDVDLIEPLTANEMDLRDFLVNNYGDGRKFKFYDIDKALKNENSIKVLLNYFNNWRYNEIDSKTKRRFFERGINSTLTVLYCIAPLFMGLLGVFCKPLYSILILCVLSFPVLIYLAFSIRRTKEGNELYYRWRALRLFMEDIVT